MKSPLLGDPELRGMVPAMSDSENSQNIHITLQIPAGQLVEALMQSLLQSPELKTLVRQAATAAIQQHSEDENTWLTADEAAQYLRITKTALNRRRQRGQIRGTRSGKSYLYRRAEIQKHMKIEG